MFDTKLRPVCHQVLEPLARPVARRSADSITVIGGLVGTGAALAAAFGLWPVAVVAWLANRILDGVDGMVARFTNGTGSDSGGYLDMSVDVLVYALVPLGVATGVGSTAGWIAVALLLASFYFNTITWAYLAAVLERRQATNGHLSGGEQSTSILMPPGLIEGAETIVLFTVLLVSPMAGPTWPVVVMGAMAASVAVGGFARLSTGLRVLR